MQTFPFVSSKTLRLHFQFGKWQESDLRKKLPSPLYWIQPNRRCLYNLYLVKDYLLNGDSPEHQILIESYLATLPRSA